MDKVTAEEIMERLRRANDALNEVCHAIEIISDIDEKKHFRKLIAEVVLDVYEKLMAPIIQTHPELDPDKAQD